MSWRPNGNDFACGCGRPSVAYLCWHDEDKGRDLCERCLYGEFVDRQNKRLGGSSVTLSADTRTAKGNE